MPVSIGIPTEFVGDDVAISINGQPYRAQRIRIHMMGELGDVTGSEDDAKRRAGTVPDWEVTVTKASFDPDDNMYGAPLLIKRFEYIDMEVYPGGRAADFYDIVGALVREVDHDFDTQMLQPVTFTAVCGAGEDIDVPLF